MMKVLWNIVPFSKYRNIFLTILFSGSVLFQNFTSAQFIYAKLNDTEITTVITILKAEIAGYKSLDDKIASAEDTGYQLFLDIQSGKTDPLDWLKQHSNHILVPPGVKYLPACSREASIKGWELFAEENVKPKAVPTAIFSFGIDFPAINKTLTGENISGESYAKFLESPYDASDPSVEKMKSVIKDAASFYTTNGFRTSFGMSGGSILSFYHPDEEGKIEGNANIFDWTLLDPLYPAVIKQCRLYIMRPVIEIRAESELMDEIYNSTNITNLNNSIDEITRNSLKRAGITEDRYALIKSSLLTARHDSEYPEGIEIPSFDFTPTTQEEKEIAKTVAIMREEALARKNNITIYNKFKAELDPILDILQKYMGGQ